MSEAVAPKRSSVPIFLLALWLLALTGLLVFMFMKTPKNRENSESQKNAVVKQIDIAAVEPSDVHAGGDQITAIDERLVKIEKQMETLSAVEDRVTQIEEQTKDLDQVVTRVEALERYIASSDKIPPGDRTGSDKEQPPTTIKPDAPLVAKASEPAEHTHTGDTPETDESVGSTVDEVPIIRDKSSKSVPEKPPAEPLVQSPIAFKTKKPKYIKTVEQEIDTAWDRRNMPEELLPQGVRDYQENMAEYPYGMLQESGDISRSGASLYQIGQRYAPSYGVDRNIERSVSKTAPGIVIFPSLSIR